MEDWQGKALERQLKQYSDEAALLRKEVEKYRLILEEINLFYCEMNLDGQILLFNSPFCTALGYESAEVAGLPYVSLMEDSSREMFSAALNNVLKTGLPSRRFDYVLLKKNGALLNTETSIFLLNDDNGRPIGYRILFQDITRRKQSEELIKKLAFQDTLTGLPNRRLFHDRLVLELNQAKRNKERFAVMMIDLDRFKEVNDTLGHYVGDLVIQAVGQRLTNLLRKGDTVARIGGDEFILLLPTLQKEDNASRVAEKILSTFNEPFYLGNHQIHITPSIGIAIYPDHGNNMDLLLRNSDIAMYAAKEDGRNTFEYYRQKATTGETSNQ
jgi:diguanylate cyclase (GGDEF)-like protein/PAS domain S-box-containing protein